MSMYKFDRNHQFFIDIQGVYKAEVSFVPFFMVEFRKRLAEDDFYDWLQHEALISLLQIRYNKLDNYQDVLDHQAAYDLLAVDNFGLMNLDINKCRNLFVVFDRRDPHKSILMISQIPVASWYDMFLEHTYAEACLVCLLTEAYRLEMNGRNMKNIEPLNKQPYTTVKTHH